MLKKWLLQDELESFLDDSGHLRTLAIWRILARNYGAGLWKDMSENGSHETLGDKKSGEGIAAIEASKILKTSSDEELILEHLGWVCTSA
jgi:vacuolar protein sorting-associated protein 3